MTEIDIAGVVLRLALATGSAIDAAIKAGDVLAVDLLTRNLDGPDALRARDEALLLAQRRRAEIDLGAQ